MKISKYNIKDKLITNYIEHFNASKKDLWEWERKRKELHEAIFKSVKVKRTSKQGQILSDEVDKYCIPLIEKTDYMVAGLKKIGIAKNQSEMMSVSLDLQNRMMFENLQKQKAEREKQLVNLKICRVCKRDLSIVGGRVNDQLANNDLKSKPVDNPICIKCTEKNPDEHFIEFKEKFWNKK